MRKVSKIALVAAAFTVSSMLIAGCGAKTADRAPAPGALQSGGDPQNVITKENFDTLSSNLSLSDLEGMYGKATFLQQSMVRDLRICRQAHDFFLQLRLCMQVFAIKCNKDELYQDKDNNRDKCEIIDKRHEVKPNRAADHDIRRIADEGCRAADVR